MSTDSTLNIRNKYKYKYIYYTDNTTYCVYMNIVSEYIFSLKYIMKYTFM